MQMMTVCLWRCGLFLAQDLLHRMLAKILIRKALQLVQNVSVGEFRQGNLLKRETDDENDQHLDLHHGLRSGQRILL